MLIQAGHLPCRYCSKFRAPEDLMGAGARGLICRYCFEWHKHALAVLNGETPSGCQECGTRLEEISPGVEIRMYVVPKDGCYQVLCKRCCDSYVARRRDVYGATEFGRRLKL